MKNLTLLFLLSFSFGFGQTLDYNIKKGFAANGYDVVAYFNNEAIEGHKKFRHEYDSVNYKFSSKEHLDAFKTNPEKFIPQYGGYCAYAIAIKENKVSINPKTFKIINDKLYLFYNAWGTNTLELWNKEHSHELLNKADKNWEKIKFKK
ncbi:YHS domain-containing (seleno)protein [Flavivirga abyssicola]|uniref:YHS domain-containing (seleno)protein n=1 Tax=Flavivirga abyssicola TaxID=3063533 RepID=UPI0026DF759B|nr:YHS domain-containing (seleno)protein [Flavivirga sp. MEBiC07777]WVK14419.1 YHS domain-containing (seleno)protein [Flavivirga sp. MEBiC07777]